MSKIWARQICIGALTVTALVVGVSVPASAANLRYEPIEDALSELTLSADTADQAVLNGLAAPKSADSETALATHSSGVEVIVENDRSQPISLTSSDGGQLEITLPSGKASGSAEHVTPGVVAFDQEDGSHAAVAAKVDGSLQLLSVISEKAAPTRFSYGLSTDEPLELNLLADGSVAAYNEAGVPILAVAAPWATDANGNAVVTRFEVVGQELTQVVDHNIAGVAYPVVADPKLTWYWWGYITKFSKSETKQIANASTNAGALAILCGLIASAPGAVACGIAGFLVANFAVSWAKGVVSRGHCIQLNTVFFTPAIPFEVTC
jgi:hypothetical protein